MSREIFSVHLEHWEDHDFAMWLFSEIASAREQDRYDL